MNTFSLPVHNHSPLPPLLLVLVMLVGTIFWVKPLWDTVNELKVVQQQKQEQHSRLTQQFQELQSMQQSFASGSEVSQHLTLDAIPERFEQDKLITDLTALAQKSGVVFNGINFGLVSGNDTMKRATLNINVTGDDDTLIAFLKGIEGNPRKMIVKSMTVQAGKTDTGVPRINFTVNVETFFQERL